MLTTGRFLQQFRERRPSSAQRLTRAQPFAGPTSVGSRRPSSSSSHASSARSSGRGASAFGGCLCRESRGTHIASHSSASSACQNRGIPHTRPSVARRGQGSGPLGILQTFSQVVLAASARAKQESYGLDFPFADSDAFLIRNENAGRFEECIAGVETFCQEFLCYGGREDAVGKGNPQLGRVSTDWGITPGDEELRQRLPSQLEELPKLPRDSAEAVISDALQCT